MANRPFVVIWADGVEIRKGPQDKGGYVTTVCFLAAVSTSLQVALAQVWSALPTPTIHLSRSAHRCQESQV